MGKTTQFRGVGFSEACELSRLREESASDYYETVRPKEILSNEAEAVGASASVGRGREETEEESAKRRKFLKESEGIDELVENHVDDEEAGECILIKAKRAPNEPTNEEVRLHEVTHTPYRSWCKCVLCRRAGKGRFPF